MRRLSACSLLLLASATLAGCNQEKPKLAATKPPVVLVSQPTADYVTDFEDFTGRTDAVFTVEVRSRVTGYLSKVFFKDGVEVNEGDPLFEIDPRPYQAALDSAEASVVQSEAHLKRLEADHRRAQNLYARSAIGREEYDKINGDFTEAGASLGISKAARDLAKLNLYFTKVIAPISGRTSRRLVDPGNLVQQDTTALTTIVSLDPMYVYFDIDERTLLGLRRLVREGKIRSRNEADILVLVALADEAGFPHQGTINFSENKVDPSTGTLRVRAVMANPKASKGDRVLSPGLFVRVRLPVGDPHKSILIDEQALGTDQGRKFLYIVNDKNEVVYRPVKVGRLNNGKRVIDDGLLANERVIISGLQRVRPGAKVEPKMADGSPSKPRSSSIATGSSPETPAKKAEAPVATEHHEQTAAGPPRAVKHRKSRAVNSRAS